MKRYDLIIVAVALLIGGVLACFGAELTLTFEPQLQFTQEKGHAYTLYSRASLTDPWMVQSEMEANMTNDVQVTYCFYFWKATPVNQFYWLQRDDEVPLSIMKTNKVMSITAPPVPGETK